MERLGPELLSLIIAHLYIPDPHISPPFNPHAPVPRPPFVPYAAISRRWQHAVEPRAFAAIKLRSTELPDFARIFSSPRRRALLRRLAFDVVLPEYVGVAALRRETAREHAANADVFARALHTLFKQLRHWELDGDVRGGPMDAPRLEFSLGAHSDSDPGHPNAPPGLGADRMEGHFLTIEGFELPEVERISRFELPLDPCRHIHPSAAYKLIAAMPNIQDLDLSITEPRRKRELMRREHRIALATGLESLDLKNLTHLRIRHEAPDPLNHSVHTGNLHDLDYSDIDSLNTALRKVSQMCPLVSMELVNAIVSPELFQDLEDPKDPVSRTWPSLERLDIDASLVTPDGRWYYTGDPNSQTIEPLVVPMEWNFGPGSSTRGGESGTESGRSSAEPELLTPDRIDKRKEAWENGDLPVHQWRTKPDREIFDPMVKSMLDAVARMPALKRLTFQIGMGLPEPKGIKIAFLDAGEKLEEPLNWAPETEDEVKLKRWKLEIGEATDWEPVKGLIGTSRIP